MTQRFLIVNRKDRMGAWDHGMGSWHGITATPWLHAAHRVICSDSLHCQSGGGCVMVTLLWYSKLTQRVR